MLARLLLELLAIAPGLVDSIDSAAGEMHTNDSTGTKAKAAAAAASTISIALAKVIGDLTD